MDDSVIRLATMADYEELGRLFKELDDHHVALLPDLFQPFPPPPCCGRSSRPRLASYAKSQSNPLLGPNFGSILDFE